MKPYKLDEPIVKLLEERILNEYTAQYFYQAAANWCTEIGYLNAGKFFLAESNDELTHSQGLQEYLVSWNIVPKLPSIAKPQIEFKTLPEILDDAYKMEYDLYEAYEKISNEIFKMGDTCTFDFLKKYRKIQRLAVAEYSDFLNKLELIDVNNKLNVYLFEQNEFNK
jgi:ferritin